MIKPIKFEVELADYDSVREHIHLTQYDRGFNIEISILEHGLPYILQNDEAIQIDFELPENSGYILSKESINIIDSNTISFAVNRNITLNSGIAKFNIAIVDKTTGITKKKSTNQYTIDIAPNALSEDFVSEELIVSAKEELDKSIENATEVLDRITSVDNKAFTVNSTKWTSKTENGEIVYTYTINHNLGSTNILVDAIDIDDNVNVIPIYKVISSNAIEVRTLEKLNIRYIISANYRLVDEVISSNYIQEVEDARGSYSSLDKRLKSVETTITTNVNTLNSKITTNKNNITTLDSKVVTNKNNITALQAKTNHIKFVSTVQELDDAIDNAVNGDIIYIKAGTYVIDRSFEIPKGVTIKGSGINNCIFDCRSASINNVFRNKLTGSETGYNTFDIVIEGINFNGYDTTNNITVIAMAHAQNVIVQDCMFQRFNNWHNIELNGCQLCYIQRNRFSNYGYISGGNPTEVIQLDFCRDNVNYPWTCNYDNTHCKNIYIEENNFFKIKTTSTGAIGTHNYSTNSKQFHKDIFVRHNTLDTVQSFFHLLGSQRIHIDNNGGENVGTFVTIGSNGYRNQIEGTISGNIISGDIETGTFGGSFTSQGEGRFVYGKDSTDTISGFTIANNVISNFNRHAIGLTGNGIAITGNKITGTGRNGIYLYGGWRYTVTGNTLYDNNRNTTATFYGIALGDNTSMSLSKSVIVGNVCGSISRGSNMENSVTETNNIID